MKHKNFPFYLTLVIGIAFGILAIHIFKGFENKTRNDWIGIIGAMFSLIGIILSIKSFINFASYYSCIKYVKLDTKLKKILQKVPDITRNALTIQSKIKNSKGKLNDELDQIKDKIDDYCNELTNLFNDVNEYNKVYNNFLLNGKKDKVTTILSEWTSGSDSRYIDALQHIHEDLPNTVNSILEKNKEKIDKNLVGALY